MGVSHIKLVKLPKPQRRDPGYFPEDRDKMARIRKPHLMRNILHFRTRICEQILLCLVDPEVNKVFVGRQPGLLFK